MSLSSNISDLTTRIATEIKALRTLINGNAADLSSLTTTAKTNLVAAVNEVNAAVASSSGIDDETTSTSSTWSSTKIDEFVGDEIAAIDIPDPADLINDTTPSTSSVYSSTKTDSQISAAVAAAEPDLTDLIDDASASTSTVYSSTKTDAQIAAEVAALVDSAPGTLDTLSELADALGSDPDFATTVTTALGNRVRTDTAAQGLNGTQQTNARTNIAAASAVTLSDLVTAVGTTTTNYVTVFEAGLT